MAMARSGMRLVFGNARRVLALFLAAILLTSYFQVIEAATAPEAKAANSSCIGGYTNATNKLKATPSHGQVMYIDSGVTPKVDAAYVGYKIDNTDTVNARSKLWVKVDSFAGGKVTLANPADEYQQINSIAANGTATVFFLLKASGAATTAQTHTVHVYDKRPDLIGASELLVCDFAFQKVVETIKASANKVNTVTSTPTPAVPTLGGTVVVAVTSAATGKVGSGTSSPDGSAFWSSPAGVSSWPTRALRLESTTITISCQNPNPDLVLTNQLFVNGTTLTTCTGNGNGSNWTASYTYRIIGPGPAATKPAPVAFIASGTQFKHSDPSAVTGGTINLSGVASTALVVTVSASGTPVSSTSTTVTIQYTVAISTTSTSPLVVDEVVDTHQSGTTFVAGSVRMGTNLASLSTAADPSYLAADSTKTPPPYHFVGPFSVTSSATYYITYQFVIPCGSSATTYTTTVVAYTGDVLIGSSSTQASASAVNTTSTGGICSYTVNNTDISLDPTVVTQPADTVTDLTANINAFANPSGGSGVTFQFAWSRDPNMVNSVTQTGWVSITGTSSIAKAQALSGLSQLTTYYFQGQVKDSTGKIFYGDILSFTTAATAAIPTVTTTAASNIAATTVTLNGSLNPNLTAITGVYFLLCTDSALTVGCKAAYQVVVDNGSGTAANLVFAANSAGDFVVNSDKIDGTSNVTALATATRYFYKLYVTCTAGTYCPGGTVSGATLAFTTGSPSATTLDATVVGETTATLNGNVNANGSTSTVAFCYGTDATQSAGLLTNCSSVAGSTPNISGSSNTAQTAAVTSLTGGTTYYFQVKVTVTATGVVAYGAVLSFTTIKITTASPLSGGSTGTVYNASFAGTGGSYGYTWSKTGSLPAGLTLTADGLLSGTPTTAGVYSIVIVMTDISFGTTTTKTFALTINATLTYAGNGNTGGAAPAAVTNNGVIQLATAGTLTRTNYSFGGWNINGTVYAAGANYTLTANATANAIWNGDVYTITYNSNTATGGALAKATDTYTVGTSSAIVLPGAGTMTRTGYNFGGWSLAAGTDGAGTGAVLSPYTPSASLTLYAIWTPNTYTITYNRNYGTTTTLTDTYTYGNTTALQFNSGWTRTGYTFLGYSTNSTDTTALTSYTVTSDATLYAIWQINSYTITYSKNDGSGTTSNQNYNYGTTTALSYSSGWSRTGYTFGGWSGTNTGTALGSYTVTQSAILYAVWTPDTYTITYDTNTADSGSPTRSSDSFTVGVTSPIALPAVGTMVKSGYTFLGWSLTAGSSGAGGASVADPYTPTGSVTLYARWTTQPIYTVTFKPNFSGPADATQSSTTAANLVANPFTRTGYTFQGWATTQVGADAGTVAYANQASYPFTSNANLYAVWQINSYTLTYAKNDGSGTTATQNYNYGATNALGYSSGWTRTGYTLLGWAETNGATSALGSYTVTAPATLYAVWQLNSYTITYAKNDGSGTTATQSLNHGNITALSYDPSWTYVGYTFQGWALTNNATTALTSYTVTGAVTLFAVWTIDLQAVTYAKNDGSGISTIRNLQHGDTTALTYNSGWTRTGYTLLGWALTDNAVSALATYTVTGDVTLYAVWQINSYTITFNKNDGGSTNTTANYNYGATNALNFSNPFTRTGYTFLGWSTTNNATTPSGSYTVTASASLYAVWQINSFVVTYHYNDGVATTTTTHSFNYGSTNALDYSTGWTRTGYALMGWMLNSNDTQELATYTVTQAVDLYARWDNSAAALAVPVTVTFKPGSAYTGSQGDTYQISSAAANLDANPFIRTGYSFGGWSLVDGSNSVAYANNAQYSFGTDVTLFAIWIPEVYTVTFNYLGGTTGTLSMTFTVGNPGLNLPTSTRTGFTFGGWSPANGGSNAVNNPYSPTGTILLYAIWIPPAAPRTVTMLVHFHYNGGTQGVLEMTYTEGELPLTLPTSVMPNYKFGGWCLTNGGTTPVENSYTPLKDTDLYAIWIGQQFTVTLVPLEPNRNNIVLTYNYGGTPLTLPNMSKPNYQFNGWSELTRTTIGIKRNFITDKNVTLWPVWQVLPAGTPIYFTGDSPVITRTAYKELVKLANKVKRNVQKLQVIVDGWVKETNDKSYDIRLSRDRATNTVKVLRGLGVDAYVSLTPRGISPENTPKSRRTNVSIYSSGPRK